MTWTQRLAEAVLNGKFTQDDKWAAASWATCKVGEHVVQHKAPIKLARWCSFPEDDALYDLGVEFMQAVMRDEVARAIEVAFKIDKQVKALTAEEVPA